MVTIILVDRNNVIHDVFVATQLSKLEIEEIDLGAKMNLLTAIIRSATIVDSAQDVLVEIAAINEASTDEVVHVECGPCEAQKTETVPPSSGIKQSVDESFFDLDWDVSPAFP